MMPEFPDLKKTADWLSIKPLLSSRKKNYLTLTRLDKVTFDVETYTRGSRCNTVGFVCCERQWDPSGLSNTCLLKRYTFASNSLRSEYFLRASYFLKLDLGSGNSTRLSVLFFFRMVGYIPCHHGNTLQMMALYIIQTCPNAGRYSNKKANTTSVQYCPRHIIWSLTSRWWRGKLVRGEAQGMHLQLFSFHFKNIIVKLAELCILSNRTKWNVKTFLTEINYKKHYV